MLSSSLGSIVRETSNFLVAEKVLSSAQDSISFLNLDGFADGGYTLDIHAVSAVSNTAIGLLINSDGNTANYSSQYVRGYNTGTSASNVDGPNNKIAWFSYTVGTTSVARVEISIVGGVINILSTTTFIWDNGKYVALAAVTYSQVVSNITSITLQGYANSSNTVTAGCFGIGTTARLYRKKQGLPSAFPSASSMLVADILTSSNSSTITLTGLDGITHGGYDFELWTPAASGYVQLFVNGDTTGTNYYCNILDSFSATVSNTVANNAYISQLSNNQYVYGRITLDGASKFRVMSFASGDYSNSLIEIYSMHKTAAITNITSLTFNSLTANNLLANSKLRLYRRK